MPIQDLIDIAMTLVGIGADAPGSPRIRFALPVTVLAMAWLILVVTAGVLWLGRQTALATPIGRALIVTWVVSFAAISIFTASTLETRMRARRHGRKAVPARSKHRKHNA